MSTPLSGVVATGSVGIVGVQLTGWVGLRVRLPRPVVRFTALAGAVGTLTIALPRPKVQLTGKAPVFGTLAVTLPTSKFAATGLVSSVGQLQLRLPMPRLVLNQGPGLAVRLPRPRFTATGAAGGVGVLTMRLPKPAVALAGMAPVIGTLQLVLPVPRVQLQSTTGSAGRLAITLRRISLAMQGATGAIGTLALRLPVVNFTASGFWPAVGTLKLVLPTVRFTANGGAPQTRTGSGAPPAANANTIAMHTERLALTQYTNYPFNSFAKFNGTYIGASDDGLFVLTGDTDNGAAIQAVARVGVSDMGTSHLKRVDRLYVGYRCNGQMIVRVITDENEQRDYLVTAPESDELDKLHGGRVRMGRGVQSRYWQFELRNVNGTYFAVDIIELKPTKLRRRFGGRDA